MKNFFFNRIKKRLIIGFTYKAGRNFLGRKTIFTQGGGKFTKFFLIDYKRVFPFSFKLLNIFKDYNRNSLIGFICYEIGVFSYILLSEGVTQIGDLYKCFVYGYKSLESGNSTFLGNIELGNKVHHIELKFNKGAKLVRASGTKALVVSRDEKRSLIKLPSGWLMKLSNFCIVVNGIMAITKNIKYKAGQNRHLGFRPRVRGVAMNPCDHPHGGGEGKKAKPSVPKTPWGFPTKSPTKLTKKRYQLKKLYKKKI